MVKLIGMLLIASSLLLLAAGIFIDLNYGSSAEITGNAISNILAQAPVKTGFFDYLEAVAFSCSAASLIMGAVFLFRV